MVFESLSLLIATPIHKKTIGMVDQKDCGNHIAQNAESGNPSEETDDQAEPSKELCADREERNGRWKMHVMGKKSHCAMETVATEPAQHFLRAVSEEYQPRHHAKNRNSPIVGRRQQFAEHKLSPSVRVF